MVFGGTLLRVRIGVGAVLGMDDRADSPAFSFALVQPILPAAFGKKCDQILATRANSMTVA